MFEGVSQNYHPVVGSIMHGTPIKRKTSDEPSVSPRNVITPPQPKPSERKVSQIHRKSETPPHLPTPLKEEMRRPSSVSRATPDRKTYSVSVSPGMASHHRSHSTQSLHLPPKPSFPLVTHPSTEHLQHTVATDPRFMSQYLNFQSQGLPAAKDINTLMQEFSRTNQIPATFGIPALLRSFPPGMPDNLENSRHNLLTQDYHTAQLMQQQLEAARRSPFSVMSVPSNTPLATRPVLVSAPNFNSLV
uniref:Uncharacterized protein n=1 Tax=Ciona savignyi TaxID=51511 RepID=H2YNR7_CIOSA